MTLRQNIICCKLYLAFFSWLLIGFYASAQTPELDSIKHLIYQTKSDTAKAKLYIELTKGYWYIGNFSDSKSFTDTALSLSEKNHFENS